MSTKTKYALGIDLGTAYSLIAEYRSGIIANDYGERMTPSTVSFSESERLIGTAAKNQAARNTKNTIINSKRVIGRNFDDPIVQEIIKSSPVKIIKSSHNTPLYQVKTHYYHSEDNTFHTFHPEEITAMMLSYMQSLSHVYLHHDSKDCVISVPTHFNYSQRKSVLDAAKIANLNVLQLINSTTAVALRFAHINHANYVGNTMVIDFGAGSCNVSIISINENIITVLGNAANDYLGSEDIDTILTNYFARKFNNQNRKLKLDVTKSHYWSMRRLRTSCERVKRTLNTAFRANIEIDSLLFGMDYAASITRNRYEDLCMDLFDSCVKCMTLALSDASVLKSEIDNVLVAGGCCRSYLLHEKVKMFFQGTKITGINRDINCDEGVAFGTAIQAAMLMNIAGTKWQINDSTRLSVWLDDEEIIPMRSKLPCTVVRQFQTTEVNQRNFAPFKVYVDRQVGIRLDEQKDNINLFGEFRVVQIPAMAKGSIVDVVFHIDGGGALAINTNCDDIWCMILLAGFIRNIDNLKAFIPESIKGVIIQFGGFDKILLKNPLRSKIECRKNGLDDEQIQQKIIEFMEYEKVENENRSRIEARNQLEDMAYQMKNTVDDSKIQEVMSCENKKIVLDAVKEVLDWVDYHDDVTKEVYEGKQKELEDLWKPIITECYSSVQSGMPRGMPDMGCCCHGGDNHHFVSDPIIDDVD